MNDSLNESLDSKLKIAGGEQNVSPDVFMHAGVLLKECLNIFSVNPALLTASVVDVGNFMITQEGSKVLRVPDVFTFLQYCRLTCHIYLLSPHDRVKKIWNGPTFSSIAFSSILLTLQYLN